jgi:hypothetical protein
MGVLRKPPHVTLSGADAAALAKWLYGSRLGASQMTQDDRGFLQAVLVEMIEASFAMGFVEALFHAMAKIPEGPTQVLKSFLKGAGKTFVRYRDRDDLEKMIAEPKIYQSVLSTATLRTRSLWAIREQTGELIY